jgi:hypothetical protein
MARKKERTDSSVVLFDVFYQDGSRASNRKVPGAELGGLDGDAPAMTFIMDQDRKNRRSVRQAAARNQDAGPRRQVAGPRRPRVARPAALPGPRRPTPGNRHFPSFVASQPICRNCAALQ